MNLWHDRLVQGYSEMSLAEIMEMMKNNQTIYYQKKSITPSFQEAEEEFLKAIKNPEKLATIIVPTHLNLGLSIMYNLLPHNIHLVGITDKPIPADGFLRPTGDFFMHDMRHSAHIYTITEKYFVLNNISDSKREKIVQLSDTLLSKLFFEIRSVKNDELRNAIQLVSFNFHHEQGLPLLPSSYRNKSPALMTYLLYYIKRISGQDPKFRKPKTMIPKAYEWLQEFWIKYATMESDILQREPIKLENAGSLRLK